MSAMSCLAGKTALVTAGPTREPIDPVRFISNYSSGKQGYAIAKALVQAGVKVTLVSGPVTIDPPENAIVKHVQTAQQMLEESLACLPVDIAVCCAAVSDWQVSEVAHAKLKKEPSQNNLALELIKTPDILATLGHHRQRPTLLVGFAAETHNHNEYVRSKLSEKNCDWVVANDVSDGKVFGQDTNHASLYDSQSVYEFGLMSKADLAQQIVARINLYFNKKDDTLL